MLSVNAQMKHLRQPPRNMAISGSSHKRQLKNLGYYHGYKGYRFIGSANNPVDFRAFDEVIAVNQFDMDLKTLLYPKVMFIETAIKNYALEAILLDAKTENFDRIFSTSFTSYRSYPNSSGRYKEEIKQGLKLKGRVNHLLLDNLNHSNPIVQHFFNADKPVPIWALFEVMTLGDFGLLYSCLDDRVKQTIVDDLRLPSKFDSKKNLKSLIYLLKDLRNAIAHNKVVFDVRFKTGKTSKALLESIREESGVKQFNLEEITDYVVLVTYLLRKLGCSKTECKRFTRSFSLLFEKYRSDLPVNVYNKIIGTDARSKLRSLEVFISAST